MEHNEFLTQRIIQWDRIAQNKLSNVFNSYYHKRLADVFASLIPPGSKILEIGCGNGDLLASLKPNYGVGIDFSPQQYQLAKSKYPDLTFVCTAVEEISSIIEETFDFLILSDLVNDLWDVESTFKSIAPYCNKKTRIILNYYSHLWEPILSFAQLAHLANPTLQQNWLTREDLNNLLQLSGFEVIKNWVEILLPVNIPLLASICNKFLVKIWPFSLFALSNFMLARRLTIPEPREYSVSVIVPARNEAGNIENIFKRLPEMGSEVEIIFIEGHSTDNTYEAISNLLDKYPKFNTQLAKQDGRGKGDAVRKGFALATGEILMILDADLTVPPEYLPRFYEALATNKGEFINGVRLVYPMEKEAMRFFNFLGNKLFSLAFSYLLGQSIKDTLCGTKALFKMDYNTIAKNRSVFGNFDPYGDYDLLFGAARLGLKIVDMPIRYRERKYGKTNINRWSHGWLLLKMVAFAAGKLKFI